MDALTEYNDEIKAKYLKEIAALEAENARLKADLSFYQNKCAKCGSVLGLLHEDACPLCNARRQLSELRDALPDDLYKGSKDWRESNTLGRIEWLKACYESAKSENNVAWSMAEKSGLDYDELREAAAWFFEVDDFFNKSLFDSTITGWTHVELAESFSNAERTLRALIRKGVHYE